VITDMGHSKLRRWYLRGLAVIAAVAFTSLWSQIHGLVGSGGLLPYEDFLAALEARSHVGAAFWRAPTLLWWLSADWALDLLCGGGLIACLLLFFHWLEGPSLIICAVCYLSLSTAGQVFLSYQWDTLLMETLVVALFVASWSLCAPRDLEPSWSGLWLQRWLCFRLMVFGGLVKLLSGDESWRDGTAMGFHYMTQPLPNPLSWYAHQLPPWWHSLEGGFALTLEIALPFLMFFGRRARGVVFFGLSFLMLGLMVTGNYGFFQLLALLLCFSLLDDGFLGERAHASSRRPSPLGAVFAAVWFGLSGLAIHQQLIRFRALQPLPVLSVQMLEERIYRAIRPFRVVNTYGLFATMTRSQPEIIFEGSTDGRVWQRYGFAYKQAELERVPIQVAPHMPRLDWQLWFAALAWRPDDVTWIACRRHRYVLETQRALLAGNERVLGLFGYDPFPENTPKYVRAVVYDYRFTDRSEAGAAWWTADYLGNFCPTQGR
jgi:hypothetical protein